MNFAFVMWALTDLSFYGGQGILYKGKCDSVTSMINWIQLLITIVSGLLLGISNYCMQIISARTRDIIDTAHAQGRWLDIGVQSIRNLCFMPKSNKFLWIALAVNFLAIHPSSLQLSSRFLLLTLIRYNSAIFSSLSTNDYNVISVTPDFLDGAPWHLLGFLPSWADPEPRRFDPLIISIQQRARSFERLEPVDCISSYAKPYVSSRKHVLLVVDNETTDGRIW